MNLRQPLTPERLRELLDYNPDTGIFTWKMDRGGKARKNKRAGRAYRGDKYQYIVVDDRKYMSHRLAWLWVTGAWPAADIDHINGYKLDNRFANLRQATRSQNCSNVPRRASNTSGFKGVSFHRATNKWSAVIDADGKRFHLGLFTTPEDAHAAYCRAAHEYHGEFARVS